MLPLQGYCKSWDLRFANCLGWTGGSGILLTLVPYDYKSVPPCLAQTQVLLLAIARYQLSQLSSMCVGGGVDIPVCRPSSLFTSHL